MDALLKMQSPLKYVLGIPSYVSQLSSYCLNFILLSSIIFFSILLSSPSVTKIRYYASCASPTSFERKRQRVAGTAKIGTRHLVSTSSTLPTRGLPIPTLTTNTTKPDRAAARRQLKIMKRPNAAGDTTETIFTHREILHQKATKC
jgi:hypothetical protein